MAEQSAVHHHRSWSNLARVATAEIVGSFFYIGTALFVSVAAKLGYSMSGGTPDVIAVTLATGLALMLMVASLGHVSGAHVNPAITVAQMIAHNLEKRYIPLYFTAQLIGGVLAALAVWLLLPNGAFDKAWLGMPTATADLPLYKVFGVELLAGFLSGMVTISLTKDGRGPTGISAIPVGFATTVGMLIAGPISGGSFNPAKALGPMFVTLHFDNWWLYIIAPIIGAAAGAFIYHRFLYTGQPVQNE